MKKFFLRPLCGALLATIASNQLSSSVIYVNPAVNIDNPFDQSAPYFNMPRVLPALQELSRQVQKLGYTCVQSNGTYDLKLDVLSYMVIDRVQIGAILNSYGIPSEKLVFLMLEPPVVRAENFDKKNHASYTKIFTWKDDWIDNTKYFKFCYPFPWLCVSRCVPIEERKLCTLIGTYHQTNYPNELYSKRYEIVQFFESLSCDDFDLYGVWDGSCVKNAKGRIPSKLDVLQNYKFCICYENYADRGYITEKIFDCFYAGVVPVYWGAVNVAEYINPNCYIDRRSFTDDNALYNYLKNMTQRAYLTYLINAAHYLATDNAFLFSNEYFVDSILRVLIQGYDRSILFDENTCNKIERCITIQETIIAHAQSKE